MDSNASIRPIKIFDWVSTDIAKKEYSEMMALFSQSLNSKSWILSDAGAAIFIPTDPGEEPAGTDKVKAKWREEKANYDKEMRAVYKDYITATQLLLAMLDWKCMARHDVQQAIAQNGADGNPMNFIDQFKAALAVLKNKYAPSSAADVDAKRNQMQRASDEGSEGFRGLRRVYTQCRLELNMIGPGLVTKEEEREWVFKAIKNKEVADNVTIPLYTSKPDCTADDIFDAVSAYLSTLALLDRDPYRLAVSKTPVSAYRTETQPPRRSPNSVTCSECCTRCWGNDGHRWKRCPATACCICKAALSEGDQTCPAWKTHSFPFRFTGDTVPWARGKSSDGGSQYKRKYESGGSGEGRRSKATRGPLPDELRAERKALRTAIKEYRKSEKST